MPSFLVTIDLVIDHLCDQNRSHKEVLININRMTSILYKKEIISQ